ncbi:MAG: SpoIIE family protein phosphatase [Acidobacteriia bacterium]|nr:SpoIIE family protein phosphatase [Terriglobia bacterium]
MSRAGERWRIGGIEKSFLALVLLYALLYVSHLLPGLRPLLSFAAFVLGIIALVRVLRRSLRRAIWLLRNRLIAAYILIAVVPIVLIVALAGIAAYAVIGQMAVYLVNNELSRRVTFLEGPAAGLTQFPATSRAVFDARFVPLIQTRFPHFEMLIRGEDEERFPPDNTLTPPPPAWERANGLIVRQNAVYAWVHERSPKSEITLVAPISHDLLSNLVPGLGDVDLVPYTSHSTESHVPPRQSPLDIAVSFPYPLQLEAWGSPNTSLSAVLLVHTRPSAVLATVFGQSAQWAEIVMGAFATVATLFLLVELASLVAGIHLSRTITGAVNELYLGTQHVKEGDFAHRIRVQGNDQLAELGSSFNTMTANLGQLITVTKENERLQSELTIAREVQSQLFPKAVPSLRGLTLAGVCRPASTVSGDYYDFLSISERAVAFALGDVAGKGISAALLMAAIQSNMRTQLTVTNGLRHDHLSAAALVATLNRQLYANTAPEKYATFFFALYDDVDHTLTYTNAGHLPPLLMRKEAFERLDPTGTVVGAFPGANYGEQTVPLQPGDVLVAYTDGLVEPENVYGEMFGEERLQELILRHAKEDSAAIIAHAMEGVIQWTGSSELQDDMTMLVARRL